MIKQFLAILIFLGLSFLSLANAETRSVNIGLIASLSGNWAALGDMTQKGVELAKQELESTGKIKVNLVVEDSNEAASAVTAVTAYKSLRAKGIDLFIGPSGTPGGLALLPLLKIDPVIVISPSVAVESFHKAASNIFNSMGSFEVASRLLAQTAFKSGARKVAVFSSQQPYEKAQGDAFAEEFERLGGRIVARVDPLPEITDLRAEALKLVSAKPDLIFFSVYNQLGEAAREIARLNYAGPKYTVLVDNSRLAVADGALEDTVFTTLGEPTAQFIDRFSKRFGKKPEFPADFAYDAMMALGNAVLNGQFIKVVDLERTLQSVVFSGAAGEFRFDKDGAAIRSPQLWRVRGGSLIREP